MKRCAGPRPRRSRPTGVGLHNTAPRASAQPNPPVRARLATDLRLSGRPRQA